MVKCRIMKKNTSIQNPAVYKKKQPNIIKVNEPTVAYRSTVKVVASLNNFTFNEFKKIAATAPFSQAEWATLLHVSERTLQRYAKNNGIFAAINAERILLIDKVLKEATTTFGNIDKFYQWIKKEPYMLEGNLSFNSLSTYDGIQKVLTQLGRIQQGLFA